MQGGEPEGEGSSVGVIRPTSHYGRRRESHSHWTTPMRGEEPGDRNQNSSRFPLAVGGGFRGHPQSAGGCCKTRFAGFVCCPV